jgi:ribonuclease Y
MLWDVFNVLMTLFTLLAGITLGYFYRKHRAKMMYASAEEEAKRILEDARRQAESKKREAILEARDELHHERVEFDREIRNRRAEIQRLDARILQREENLDRKVELLEKKEEEILRKEERIKEKEKEIENLLENERRQLEQISGMTAEEAKRTLMKRMEEEARYEASKMIKEIEDEAKLTAERKSRDIVVQAIQRCAAEQGAETTVSVVTLPSDEMKGRIIGREGRNIRTLETLTGVDLIIDDTPETVVLSTFDAVRREIAKISLERLILDGRIHPARIEEIVSKVQKEVEDGIRETGEQAVLEFGIVGLDKEVIPILGKLKYRTSYGQNVLSHSKEVAHLASVMASELNADVPLVKRAGLLHDIGKVLDSDVEGAHAVIGADMARKFGEHDAVVHAIAAHHGDEEPRTVEAVLIQAADAISAARPGARRESLETYIKRLEKLEAVASSFRGVEKAYAIQAGREVRVMVESEDVDDARAAALSMEIAKKIEEELEYPGQIKVTIIREVRIVEYAK